MCLAIPGRIVEIKAGKAVVDYDGQLRSANVIEGKYKPGDYVIVQGKIIIEKVPKAQIRKWKAFLKKDYVA